MAKKTSTIRVFELARELSVTSKDVIAKCEAEGIPNITNHMSTMSLGLGATVREWFGEGSATTAVETAAPVDVAIVIQWTFVYLFIFICIKMTTTIHMI